MLRSLSARRALPLAALVSASLLIAGCGGSGGGSSKATDSPSATPSATIAASVIPKNPCDIKSGTTSGAVKVTGKLGKPVQASFTAPMNATDLQRTILDPATGKTVAPGAKVPGLGRLTARGDKLNLVTTLYLGSDGKVAPGSGGAKISAVKGQLRVGDPSLPAVYVAGSACVPVGSRIVTTVPARDVLGASGNADLGVKPENALIFVTDVVSIEKQLTPKKWVGAPKVTFRGAQVPKVALVKGKGSKDLLLDVIKAGKGAKVLAGDTVTVDYAGFNQRTGKVFDSSYKRGTPASFPTDGVVQGFAAALIGQRAGTQLIVSIPAKYGYESAGSPQAGIKGTDTIVFVIEIRSTAPTTAPAN